MTRPLKILIACDSFKDALDANQVCEAISEGLKQKYSAIEILTMPLSDGGEGFLKTCRSPGHQSKNIICMDGLMRETNAEYIYEVNQRIAYIESAEACGIQKIERHKRNPLYTTTYGVGEIIADAINQGAEKMYIGLGGSGTHDLGIGMAQALGWQFIEGENPIPYPRGCDLSRIEKIENTLVKFNHLEIFGVSDVKHKLKGEYGAAKTFAHQKGATIEEVELLEKTSIQFAERFDHHNHSSIKGSGAAGGLGFGISFFLGGKLIHGMDFILDRLQFDEVVKQVDFIITGEGTLDAQTLEGKVIKGICNRKKNAEVIAICGKVELDQNLIFEKLGIKQVYEIYKPELSLAENLKRTFENLREKAREVVFFS